MTLKSKDPFWREPENLNTKSATINRSIKPISITVFISNLLEVIALLLE